MFTVNFRLGCALAMVWAVARAVGAPETAPPSSPPEIILKNTDPSRVIFLEHTGPYWTVGPLFKRIREVMAEHDETGPMFARYLADPTVVPADSLQAEVGFVSGGAWNPEPPLKSAQREGEQVVSIVVEGSYGTTTRAYSLLHDWISRNGFEAVGPLIEVYPSRPQGAPTGAHRTEIQIPVRRAPSADRSSPQPRAAVAITRKPNDAPAVSGVDPPPPATTIEPFYSIKDLVDSSRFDRVAEQLVPTDHPMPPGMQIWFGQIAFRISAVAKGLEQNYPGGSPQATALSEAIVQRYRQTSASTQVDPLAQAVVRVDTHTDPQSSQKRSIVRDLDNLLGQVALKTVDPQSALIRLSELLQRIQDTTNATKSIRKEAP